MAAGRGMLEELKLREAVLEFRQSPLGGSEELKRGVEW